MTAGGSVIADKVLLAGNASHHLERFRLAGMLFPASLGIVTTEPLTEDVARAINPQDIAVYDTRFVLDYYRLTADRRLLFGSGTNYTGRETPNLADQLRPAIEKTFPQLKGVRIDFAWQGQDGITINRIPSLAASATMSSMRRLFRPWRRNLAYRRRDHGGGTDRQPARLRHLRQRLALAASGRPHPRQHGARHRHVVFSADGEAALSLHLKLRTAPYTFVQCRYKVRTKS